MARRRRSTKKEVSLFPFLDILGCLIGSLILIITTVVLEQMDTAPVAEAAKLDDLKRRPALEQARRDRLEAQLAEIERQAGPEAERLASARARADAAERKVVDARRKLDAAEKLTIDVPVVPDAVDTSVLVAKRKQLDAEAAKLRAEIATRKKQPEQVIHLLPSASGGGPKRGVFVEAAKDTIIVHEGKKPWEVAATNAARDPRFKQLLARIAADKESIITFLVRPDGIETYMKAHKAVEAAGARSGRVPLPGSGTLDLTEAR